MRQTTILFTLLFGTVLLGGAAPQDVVPAVSPDVALEAPPVFPLSDVKRGLKGYGYTVFQSARGPERFEFEVLGVMRGYLGPGEDLIIAQLKGEQIERTGVIAGMSGSPVYVDGKLVGAVGYRFGSFTKDPIAGITPIERMLTAAQPTLGGKSPRASTTRRDGSRRSPATGRARPGAQTAWGFAEPIAVPIAVSGVHPAVLDGFAEELDRRGYGPRVASGSSATGQSGPPRRFFAGGPIAGTLVDGDISMAGIGTVTWVKGDRFLAFGHPFQGTGRSNMPVSNAEILTTVAAQSSSWKLGQATVPAGMLTDDRLHAIGGTFGEVPRTVDVQIALDLAGPRSGADAKEQVSLRVMRDGPDSGLFTAIALANTLTNRIGLERGGTVDLEAEITLSTGDKVRFTDRASLKGSAGVFIQVAIGLLGDLMGLLTNGFVDVELDAVRVNVRHTEEVKDSTIAALDVTSALIAGRPGEVAVRLFYVDEGFTERRVPLTLPRGLDEGSWRLVAAAPDQAERILREGGLLGEPLSFADLLAERAALPPPGRLSVFLLKEAQGLKVGGEGMASLPVSMQGLLEGGGGLSGTVVESEVVPVGSVDVPGVVSGQVRAKVWIESYSPPTATSHRGAPR